MLFYPDGKRSTSDPNAPSPADDPYAALFVALIGEGYGTLAWGFILVYILPVLVWGLRRWRSPETPENLS